MTNENENKEKKKAPWKKRLAILNNRNVIILKKGDKYANYQI